MGRFAVLVGCEEYSDSGLFNAPFCHADVEMVAKTLVEQCDVEKHNVLRLLFSFANHGEPETILHTLRELGKRTDEGDTVLFFFSGHGVLGPDGEAYLTLPETNTDDLPATALSVRSLNDVLRLDRRKNVRILDTCHSGFDARDARTSPQFLRSVTADAHGWVTLASCDPSEQSFVDHDRGQGVFTAALCDAIINDFEPGEGILPELLKLRVCARVEEYVRENPKKPQTPTLNGSITGNFEMLRRRPLPPVETPAPKADAAGATLKGRLDRLRGLRRFGEIGDVDHRNLLSSYIAKVAEIFATRAQSLRSLDDEEMELSDPFVCDRMPLAFAKRVTSTVERGALESLHTVVVEREYEKLNLLQQLKLTFEPARLKSIHHKVEQPARWPESYVEGMLLTSGYLPGIRVGFYLLPLRVSAKLMGFYGIISDGRRAAKLSLTANGTVTLALKPDYDFPAIETFVEEWLDLAVRQYGEAMETRIRALEQEVVELADDVRQAITDENAEAEVSEAGKPDVDEEADEAGANEVETASGAETKEA